MKHAHTNELVHETSPYLLQHAHNPVNWLPWGEKAFQLAREKEKPLLVSIGYAACHWCHVMEHESFEDEDTAKLMNDYFVCVKIDREERPDIDHIYMDAVQAMTGAGGWPLNIFLTPDLKPFYGGTYFPPQQAYNRPSWQEVLVMIHNAWQERRSEIINQAEGLLEHLSKQAAWEGANPAAYLFNRDQPTLIAENLMKNADSGYGGFGNAPKFPQFAAIVFLLEQDHYFGNAGAREHALHTINMMTAGGIYDQVGGGLARYSTDDKWLVPHFEKMMYDNALFIPALCDALLITGDSQYLETIHQVLLFMQREMMNSEYAFYTAIDADSEGVEGRFYTWELNEINELLEEDAPLFCTYYGVTQNGNWRDPHHPELPPVNILNISSGFAELSEKFGMGEIEIRKTLKRCVQKLFEKRAQRVRPLTDDKLLLALNALANRAFTRAYSATGQAAYLETAKKNMAFVMKHFSVHETGIPFSEGLKHQFGQNIPAFLDDYAFLIQALLELQEATGNTEYLKLAQTLTELVLQYFGSPDSPLFFYTREGQQDIILRKKETYDGSQPSSNAVMCENLLKMGLYFNRPEWTAQAEKMLESLGDAIARYPSSFAAWASVLQKKIMGYCELSVMGMGSAAAMPEIHRIYMPAKIIMQSDVENNDWPLFAGKLVENQLDIYICKNNTCLPPVKLPEQIVQKLAIFTPH
jgi:uncharacterized protein